MPRISYADVREVVSLQYVLDLLGYRWLRRMGRHNYGVCPLGCSSSPRCCSFDLERNLWCCHKCHRGGNQLDLYAQARSLTLYSAAIELCRQLGINPPYIR